MGAGGCAGLKCATLKRPFCRELCFQAAGSDGAVCEQLHRVSNSVGRLQGSERSDNHTVGAAANAGAKLLNRAGGVELIAHVLLHSLVSRTPFVFRRQVQSHSQGLFYRTKQ